MQEIGELYELEKNIQQAMDYYERSADLFQSEEVTTSANQCKQKVAQFAAQNSMSPFPKNNFFSFSWFHSAFIL